MSDADLALAATLLGVGAITGIFMLLEIMRLGAKVEWLEESLATARNERDSYRRRYQQMEDRFGVISTDEEPYA